jgi:hypothetical protein
MTPYWLPKVVAIACAVVYIVYGEAGRISKLVVGALLLLSLFLQHVASFAHAWTVGLVLQVGIAVYVLVYFKVNG